MCEGVRSGAIWVSTHLEEGDDTITEGKEGVVKGREEVQAKERDEIDHI